MTTEGEEQVVTIRSMQEYLDRYYGPQPARSQELGLPPAQYGALIAKRSLTRILKDAGKLK